MFTTSGVSTVVLERLLVEREAVIDRWSGKPREHDGNLFRTFVLHIAAGVPLSTESSPNCTILVHNERSAWSGIGRGRLSRLNASRKAPKALVAPSQDKPLA